MQEPWPLINGSNDDDYTLFRPNLLVERNFLAKYSFQQNICLSGNPLYWSEISLPDEQTCIYPEEIHSRPDIRYLSIHAMGHRHNDGGRAEQAFSESIAREQGEERPGPVLHLRGLCRHGHSGRLVHETVWV